MEEKPDQYKPCWLAKDAQGWYAQILGTGGQVTFAIAADGRKGRPISHGDRLKQTPAMMRGSVLLDSDAATVRVRVVLSQECIGCTKESPALLNGQAPPSWGTVTVGADTPDGKFTVGSIVCGNCREQFTDDEQAKRLLALFSSP